MAAEEPQHPGPDLDGFATVHGPFGVLWQDSEPFDGARPGKALVKGSHHHRVTGTRHLCLDLRPDGDGHGQMHGKAWCETVLEAQEGSLQV